MLSTHPARDVWKKFQGRRAHRRNTGNLAMRLLGIIRVNTTVKTSMVKRGFSSDQRKPNTEFL
jgi:hypothetical protein